MYNVIQSNTQSFQIQVCNFILFLLGLSAVGLAGSQFSKVTLDNYRLIDLRLLGVFYALTGAIGFFCVSRNYGSVVVKSMFVVSLIIGIGSAIFYGFTTYRVLN